VARHVSVVGGGCWLVRLKARDSLGDRHRMEDNVKVALKQISCAGQEHVAGCWGHGDETSVSVS
jgi:hypothetical protein